MSRCTTDVLFAFLCICSGIAAVGRKFAIVDDDGSRSMDADEFQKACKEMNLTYPLDDLKRLFAYLDHDESGRVDYDEFLVGLRGELNARRSELVGLAFRVSRKL